MLLSNCSTLLSLKKCLGKQTQVINTNPAKNKIILIVSIIVKSLNNF